LAEKEADFIKHDKKQEVCRNQLRPADGLAWRGAFPMARGGLSKDAFFLVFANRIVRREKKRG